jgi:hypothetical protein
MFLKLFYNIERLGIHPNSFYADHISLTPKSADDITATKRKL